MKNNKQLIYSIFANLLSVIVSAFITLFLPKQIDVKQYGYFQLYLFYLTYAGVLQIGWADGIYLRYGGKYYDDLKKNSINLQLKLYSIFQLTFCTGIFVLGAFVASDENKKSIIFLWALSALFANVRTIIQYLMMATGRIKEYAVAVISDRMVYVILVVVLMISGCNDFHLYAIANVIAIFISMIISCAFCKNIVLCTSKINIEGYKEACKNITTGIQLMLANIAGQLIVGISRQFIEIKWNIEVFGEISLALSISNMFMQFIEAIAIVLFPMLKRMDNRERIREYEMIRNLLMPILMVLMACYYPAKVLLKYWLPQYIESIHYLAILFPICLFEGKMTLLITTYLKTFRMEKKILLSNVISLGISLIISFASAFIVHNLNLTVLCIVITLAFRSMLAEKMLANSIKIDVWKDSLMEVVMVTIFLCSNWLVDEIGGMMIYFISLIIYLLIKRKDLY